MVGATFAYFPNYEKMRENTVFVTVHDVDGDKLGHGSGVILGNGLVLTAGHITKKVVGSRHSIRVTTSTGKQFKAEIIHSDFSLRRGKISSDLGILKVNWDREGVSVNCKPQKIGTKVYVSGNPSNFRFTITHGYVISTHSRQGSVSYDWIKTDATAVGGNSGGPIFNRWGQVVGIISHGNVEGFGVPIGLNMGVSGPTICYTLNRYGAG